MRKIAKILSILITLALLTVGLAFAALAEGDAVTPGDYTVYANTDCTEAVAVYGDLVTALENAAEGQCVVATKAPETLREPEKNIAEGIFVKFDGVTVNTENTPYVFTAVDGADYLSVDVLEYKVTKSGETVSTYADDTTILTSLFTKEGKETVTLIQNAVATGKSGTSSSGSSYYILSLTEKVNVTIDVNGYVLNLDEITYTSGAFTVPAGTKLHFYSSRTGGVIDNANSRTMIRTSGNWSGGQIIFGKPGDKLADKKLTVFSDQVVMGQSTATVSTSYGSISAYGTAFSNDDMGAAVMFSTTTRIYYTFDDCLFHVNRSGTSYIINTAAASSSKNTGALSANFTNCTFLARNSNKITRIVHNVENRTGNANFGNIVFDNCDLIGNIVPTDDATATHPAKITLKNGTRIASFTEGEANIFENEHFTIDGDILINYSTEDLVYPAKPNSKGEFEYETFSVTYKYVIGGFEAPEARYTIELPDGTIMYSPKTDTSSNFDDEVSNLICDNAKVTLYDNIEIQEGDYKDEDEKRYAIYLDRNVAIDLNGYAITRAEEAPLRLFSIQKEDIVVDLYSSRVGGEINLSGKSYVFMHGLAGGVTVNIGNDGDKASKTSELSYLNVSAGVLFDAISISGTSAATATGVVKLNINGGSYTNPTDTTLAFINARHHLNVNIEDAVLLTSADKFFATDGRYDSLITVNAKDSAFIVTADKNQFFHYFNEESTATFDNCIISAKLFETTGNDYVAGTYHKVDVTTGEGDTATTKTYYSQEGDVDAIKAVWEAKYPDATVTVGAATALSGSKSPSASKIYTTAGKQIADPTRNGKIYLVNNTRVYTDSNVVGGKNYVATEGYVDVKCSFSETVYFYEAGNTENTAKTVEFNLAFISEDRELPDTTGVKVNLTANNGFFVNFYVPENAAFTVKVDPNGYTVNNGTTYDIYTVQGIAPNTTADATIAITYKLMIAGIEADVDHVLSVSLLDYFKGVLTSGDDEAKTLVVNAVNYCNAVYNYVNKADYPEYAAILSTNADRIIAADAKAVKVDAKEQGVFGEVQFIISEGNVPMFAFTKLTDGKVSVKYKNIYGEADGKTCVEVIVDDTTYYAVAEMPVYEMVDTFEVYVNDAKIGNYSIANYAEATTDAGAKAIAEALYGYGVAVANWKIED